MARRRSTTHRRRRRGSFRFLYRLLSVLAICSAIIAAITLFFRVDHIEVSGQKRYTEEEIEEATGILPGDNLFLLNKYDIADGIVEALPYIEKIRINRKLPDTLRIEVEECGEPLAVVQAGMVWLVSPRGKIVELADESVAEGYAVISGVQLLAPSVGTQIALATEFAVQQDGLLNLLTALGSAGMLEQLDGIRMDDPTVLRMDYAGRFTVELPYEADFVYKLRYLREAIASEKIQDNMTGTFNMTRDDGRVNFVQNTR